VEKRGWNSGMYVGLDGGAISFFPHFLFYFLCEQMVNALSEL
jgi:hypothetical protein